MNREDILKKVKSVPELPAVAIKVARIIQDPDFRMNELVKAIEYAPAVAANILKMANSAFFSGPRTIGSIREAIIRLGSNAVYDLVLASCIGPIAGQEVKGYELPPGELWKHLVMTAVATSALGKEAGIKLPNYAFTAALLHDIGKVVMGNFIELDPQPILDRAYKDRVPFEVAEREILGIDHAEVGAFLLESWNLPEELIRVVRWHHDPDSSPVKDTVLDVVHVANSICMMSGMGRGVDGLNYKPSTDVNKRLGIRIATFEKVLGETMVSLGDLGDFLGGFSKG